MYSFLIFLAGKVCDNPLLYDQRKFPDKVFSGSNSSSEEYKHARITEGGWCPSESDDAYLLLDLQKEYHITEIVVMADHNQMKWSRSYSLEYGRNTTFKYSRQV
jgi:hypothetical protein